MKLKTHIKHKWRGISLRRNDISLECDQCHRTILDLLVSTNPWISDVPTSELTLAANKAYKTLIDEAADSPCFPVVLDV